MLLPISFLICVDVHVNPGPERSTSLKVGHLNARSINISRRSNVTEKFNITPIILNENFNIFAFSKTWLNASIPNHLFDISGFCPLIRFDSSDGRRAGGVAMYVSSEFSPRRRFDFETNEFELFWLEVKIDSLRARLQGEFQPGLKFRSPTGLKYCCNYMLNFSPGANRKFQ